MYKTIRFFDDMIDSFVRLIFVFVLLLGVYYVYDSWYIYHHANDTSYLRYRPASPEEARQSLGELSDDAVAWITIDGTNIDYPIMQGATNDTYLNIDPYGKFALSGSIFLDTRNSGDFSDRYSLIYGHHMEHGYMFGSLDKFMEEEYFSEHKQGTLYVKNGCVYDLILFAATETQTNNEAVFAVTENEGPLMFLMGSASIYDPPADEGWEKQIIGLSTCKTPDSIDRTCVFGYLKLREGGQQEVDLQELSDSQEEFVDVSESEESTAQSS